MDGISLREVTLISRGLLREFMARNKYTKTLAMFDEECPRTEETIDSRAKMADLLHVEPLQVRNKAREKLASMLEVLCFNCASQFLEIKPEVLKEADGLRKKKKDKKNKKTTTPAPSSAAVPARALTPAPDMPPQEPPLVPAASSAAPPARSSPPTATVSPLPSASAAEAPSPAAPSATGASVPSSTPAPVVESFSMPSSGAETAPPPTFAPSSSSRHGVAPLRQAPSDGALRGSMFGGSALSAGGRGSYSLGSGGGWSSQGGGGSLSVRSGLGMSSRPHSALFQTTDAFEDDDAGMYSSLFVKSPVKGRPAVEESDGFSDDDPLPPAASTRSGEYGGTDEMGELEEFQLDDVDAPSSHYDPKDPGDVPRPRAPAFAASDRESAANQQSFDILEMCDVEEETIEDGPVFTLVDDR